MTLTSCFTDVYKVVVCIADHTDGCAAFQRNHTHFSGRKTQGCVFAFWLFCVAGNYIAGLKADDKLKVPTEGEEVS